MSKNANKYRKPQSSKHNQRCTANPDKRRYRDTKEAQHALKIMRMNAKAELAAKGTTTYNQKRYYHCPDCNGYHLTKKEIPLFLP